MFESEDARLFKLGFLEAEVTGVRDIDESSLPSMRVDARSRVLDIGSGDAKGDRQSDEGVLADNASLDVACGR